MGEEVAANLRLWDGWTDIHMAGPFYDVEGFIEDPGSRPFDQVTLGVLGDLTGKRVLHLQSHIGIDTIALALMGAVDVMGVDFSPQAVAAAESIARRMGVPVDFVQADVTDLPDAVPAAAFDVVFTSHGTIMWLPELDSWARMIASRLVSGGVFHIIDVHPLLTVFDDTVGQSELRVRYPYFSTEPLYFEERGSYADRSAEFVADSYVWQHPLADVMGALLAAGLEIQQFSEYPVVAWQALEFMEQGDDGLWHLPPGAGDLPLMFSLSAIKPQNKRVQSR